MVAVPLMGCIMGCNSCWLYGRVNISRLNRKRETGNGGNMEREENIRDNIIKLPKIELHCHLDGSLSREFVEKRLGRTVQEAELSVSDDCTSLAQYLEKFDLPGQCIQDEKGLEGAAYDVLKGMHRENVVYAEIRFAPLLSENESMSCERVIEAALKGLDRGKRILA